MCQPVQGIELPQHRTIVGFFFFVFFVFNSASLDFPPVLRCERKLTSRSDSLFLHISGSIAHSKWLSVLVTWFKLLMK